MAKKRTTKYKKQLGQIPGALIYTGSKSSKLFIDSFDYTTDYVEEKELKNIEDVAHYKLTYNLD